MIVRHTSFQLGDPNFKVLVADDCAPNRRMFEALYKSCGCTVTVAKDGAEAIDAALGQYFDLICLDRHMPHVSGDEVAASVRSAYPRSPRPFLVLCTSDPRPGDVSGLFDAVLPKPVSPHDVVKVVARALHKALASRRRSSLDSRVTQSPAGLALMVRDLHGKGA